jgi:monovalent cation/proton antiporter MnhG/PhaG subunit
MAVTAAVKILLAAAVLSAWLAAAGLIGSKDPLARLHSAGYLTITTTFFVMLAILISEPLSQYGLKAVLTFLVITIPGAVTTHALGRAIHTRRESTDSP